MELRCTVGLPDANGGRWASTHACAAGSAGRSTRSVHAQGWWATEGLAEGGPDALAEGATECDAHRSHNLQQAQRAGAKRRLKSHGTLSPDGGIWTVASRAVISRFSPARDVQSCHVDRDSDIRPKTGLLAETHTQIKVIRAPLAAV